MTRAQPKRDRPSLATLAKELGLSVATVSNVFNRPELVAAPTRDRVLAAAAQHGYQGPDPAARQLRRGRSDTIGLIFTDELSFAFQDLAAVGFLGGVAEACEAAGRNLVLLSAGTPDHPRATSAVNDAAMDGVIVYSVADDDAHLQAAVQRGLPLVVVDQPAPDPRWDWVGPDDRGMARAVGRQLARRGHRRVGIITARLTSERHNGPVDPGCPKEYYLRGERIGGLQEGLAEHGVDVAHLPVEERYESSEAAGGDAFVAIRERHPDLTAIFCLSDALALGALRRARELGVSVPDEVSVVGFDDVGPAAQEGLTTVNQPLALKGRTAGELLLRRIERKQLGGTSPVTHYQLPSSLEIRRSLAHPPKAPR